ncbi:type-1 angiotensin II receptor-associated -like [Pelobates cultripes]|uniref:Type-1 angiotensin II receptor-associated -like n=1 Tax=Pelobates cultripes TaxID=61616 RepID=A0AAD1TD45_PELCU|nr:type-1 angiotensin II receptor-associated -like [Pelobates cultripes]
MIQWLPVTYYLANITVLAMGVWAVAQRDSADAILMFLIGLATTVITDILLFALFYAPAEAQYEPTTSRDLFRFAGGMAILSLIFKPLSCFFSYHMYRERGGECSVNLEKPSYPAGYKTQTEPGFLNVSRDRSAYQTIDHLDSPPEQDSKATLRSY